MSGQQQNNAQKKKAAIEKAQRALEEAQQGTQEQKDAATAELQKAQSMPE